jgi:hypothetical protein
VKKEVKNRTTGDRNEDNRGSGDLLSFLEKDPANQ